MNIQHISLADLVPSPRNVRKIRMGVDQLAASIRADGLLQNLIVTAREDGKFEVVAGECRRRALRQLVKQKHLPKDVTVPCELREARDATAISYAENAQRIAMHPADAIRAFATLAGEGHDEAAIANRYGYDPREVRKLLTLASLSPKVLNALAADKIDVATAQAFTLTDDHQRQERVLRHAKQAYAVRRMLTGEKLDVSDRLFRFVTLDAYRDAGGTLTSDLFDDETEGGYADNPALVEQLAEDRLTAFRDEALAEGWGEVLASITTPDGCYSWHRLYPDAGQDYSGAAKAGAALVITVDREGGAQRQAFTKGRKRSMTAPSGASAERPLYDSRIVEDLSRIRTVALQNEVAGNADLALAVLLDALLPIVAGAYEGQHAVQLRSGPGITGTVDGGINLKAMTSPFDSVADLMGQVPDSPGERLFWLIGLERDQHIRLLAACSGGLIDATMDRFADRDRLASANRIARAANLDMRQRWEGSIGFYDRLSKKALLAALTEACGADAALNCAKLGKRDLAKATAERIAGRGWLPPALVTPPEEDETPVDDTSEAEDMDYPLAAE